MWNTAKQNKFNAYLSFLVWPAFSLVYAFANYRSSFAKNILWLFIGLFGFTFVLGSEGIDAQHYKKMLTVYADLDISIFAFIKDVYNGEQARGDYYQPVLTYVLSRFTEDYRILFMLFGLVMGYFYSRNIWYLIEKTNEPIKPIAWLILIFFAFIVPFWLINGVRFWTAAHMFAFGAIRVLNDNNKKYLLVCLGSILVHIGFMLPVAVLIGFLLIGNKKWIFIPVLIASIFFINIDIPFILTHMPKPPTETIEGRVSFLENEDVLETLRGHKVGAKWFVVWKLEAVKYACFFLLLSASIFYSKKIKSYKLEPLFYFGILLLAITNVLAFLPSMPRFYSVSYLFIYTFIFLFIQKHPPSNWLRSGIAFIAPALLLYIAVEMRGFAEFCGPGPFLQNPLIVAFFEHTKAFIQYIR